MQLAALLSPGVLEYEPLVHGSAADAPAAICAWSGASTLAAYLTSASTVAPGSGLRLAAGAVWPVGWGGSCVSSPEVCSPRN